MLTTVKRSKKSFKIPCSVFNGLSVDEGGNSLGILRDHVMPYRGVGCDTPYATSGSMDRQKKLGLVP